MVKRSHNSHLLVLESRGVVRLTVCVRTSYSLCHDACAGLLSSLVGMAFRSYFFFLLAGAEYKLKTLTFPFTAGEL